MLAVQVPVIGVVHNTYKLNEAQSAIAIIIMATQKIAYDTLTVFAILFWSYPKVFEEFLSASILNNGSLCS